MDNSTVKRHYTPFESYKRRKWLNAMSIISNKLILVAIILSTLGDEHNQVPLMQRDIYKFLGSTNPTIDSRQILTALFT